MKRIDSHDAVHFFLSEGHADDTHVEIPSENQPSSSRTLLPGSIVGSIAVAPRMLQRFSSDEAVTHLFQTST